MTSKHLLLSPVARSDRSSGSEERQSARALRMTKMQQPQTCLPACMLAVHQSTPSTCNLSSGRLCLPPHACHDMSDQTDKIAVQHRLTSAVCVVSICSKAVCCGTKEPRDSLLRCRSVRPVVSAFVLDHPGPSLCTLARHSLPEHDEHRGSQLIEASSAKDCPPRLPSDAGGEMECCL